MTVRLAVSTTAMVSLASVAYAREQSGEKAIPNEPCPTGTVPTTVLVAVSMMATSGEPGRATQTSLPSGVTRTSRDQTPTGTVATTVLVAVSITETVMLSSFTT